MKTKISVTIDNNLLTEIDSIIDNIYIRNRSQALEHLAKTSLGENKKAVILAGGPERRISIASGVYRPTARINGLHVIDIAIKKLRENGFRDIYIVARHKVLTAIFELLKDGTSLGVKIQYQEELESDGTADSLRLLKGRINSGFLVVYSDVIFEHINLEGLWNEHLKNKGVGTILLTTSATPDKKGTVKVEGTRVLEFVQKPTKSDINLVFSPIFAAEPAIFEYEGNSLESFVFPKLAAKGLLYGHLSSEKEYHVHCMHDIEQYRKIYK